MSDSPPTPSDRQIYQQMQALKGGEGGGGGSSKGAAGSPSSSAPLPAGSPSLSPPLPYGGDQDLNLALQEAIRKNDNAALRLLFQAQKQKAMNHNQRAVDTEDERSSSEDEKLRRALRTLGLEHSLQKQIVGRKRKREAEAAEEEDECKEEILLKDADEEGEEDRPPKGSELVACCKAALRRKDLFYPPSSASSSSSLRSMGSPPPLHTFTSGGGRGPGGGRGGALVLSPLPPPPPQPPALSQPARFIQKGLPPPPQLLRTLSNDSLWYYTLAISRPQHHQHQHASSSAFSSSASNNNETPNRVFRALRAISSLVHSTSTISSEAASLLKIAIGKGEIDEVETVLNLYGILGKKEKKTKKKATKKGGGKDGEAMEEEGEEEEGATSILDKEDSLQAEFLCPITQDLFYEPSTLTCGHTFDRPALLDHLKTCQRNGNQTVCPSCRKAITKEEMKKLSVNKVLQGLLRRFYSSQMEALAERELEKAASSSPASADRVMGILDRYPENVAILRRSVLAFEDWCKEPANIKALSTKRVITALLRALRDPNRLTFAKERCGLDLGPLVIGLLALLTQEAKACRSVIKANFLHDAVTLMQADPLTVEPLVLVRNLLAPESWANLLKNSKKNNRLLTPAIEALNGITLGLFRAASRPSIRSDTRLSIWLLAALNRLARLSAHDGALACHVDYPALTRAVNDYPALTRAVNGLWDGQAGSAAVVLRAVRTLRALLEVTSPLGLPPDTTPAAFLSQPESLTRCLVAIASLSKNKNGVPPTPEARLAAAETIVLLMTLAFDDRGGQRDGTVVNKLREAGVLQMCRDLLASDDAAAAAAQVPATTTPAAAAGAARRLLGPSTKSLEDFKFEKVSDPSKVKISADGRGVELQGPGWAVGSPLSDIQSSFVLELGKAQVNREALWWGLCVTDEAAERAEAEGGEKAIPIDASANTPNSPFVVRKDGTLYARGTTDRYLHLGGWREPQVSVKVDLERRCATLGSARVGFQSFEGKIIRPAIVAMAPSPISSSPSIPTPIIKRAGSGNGKYKYKASVKEFAAGFLFGPQPIRMRPARSDLMDYFGQGRVVLKANLGHPLGDVTKPRFAFAFGPGEVWTPNDEVFFRFKGQKKESSLCMGLVCVGGATARPGADIREAQGAQVLFTLTILSTGDLLLKTGGGAAGPSSILTGGGRGGGGGGFKEQHIQTRIFGATTRRQLRVTWGKGIQVLCNAIGGGIKGEHDGEVIWDSKSCLRSILSRPDVTVHPFVGLEKLGDWAAIRVMARRFAKVGSRYWLSRCLATANQGYEGGSSSSSSNSISGVSSSSKGGATGGGSASSAGGRNAGAARGGVRPFSSTELNAALARSGLWENRGYAKLLSDAVDNLSIKVLNPLVPIPKRNKTIVQTFGYDASTLREMAQGGGANTIRLQRMNVLVQPEQVHDRADINKIYVGGRAQRLWVLSLRWNIDQDLYRIAAVTEVQVPFTMQLAQGDGPHQVFEIPVNPPLPLQAGMSLGLALSGEGTFLRSYRSYKYIRQDMVVMGMSDDVARDMVVGKDLCLEEQAEENVLGLGFDTVEGLPLATCTTHDIHEGVYRTGAWELPDSSDEEGRLRTNHRYRRMRFDVFVRNEGGVGLGGAMAVEREEADEEDDEEDEEEEVEDEESRTTLTDGD